MIVVRQASYAEIQILINELGFVEDAFYSHREAQNINVKIEIFYNSKLGIRTILSTGAG